MSIKDLSATTTKLVLRVSYDNGTSDTRTIYVTGAESTWSTQIMLKLRLMVHRYEGYSILSKESVVTQWQMPPMAKFNLKRLKAYAAALEVVDSEEDVEKLLRALEDVRAMCGEIIRALKS